MATRPRKTAPSAPDVAQFEASLKELEAVVARMEQGEQTLEDALRDFERGVALTRLCQGMLQNAQQRVDMLTREGKLEPFGQSTATDDAHVDADDHAD
ncbi:MAG: exodeoxyribonuclease VII small subunit [Pseudomonadota bacterium]